jgi:hypothetical protein
MKRSGFKNPGKPLAPGSGFKPRTQPMSRGTSTLTTSKPMQRSTAPIKAVGARAKRTGQGKVAPTAAERAWMDSIASFGCIVCWLHHGIKTPAAVHHILSGGRRMGHLYTIPLCDPGHHQGGSDTGPFISRHPWKARFESAYGTEMDLLAAVRILIGAQATPSPSSGIID